MMIKSWDLLFIIVMGSIMFDGSFVGRSWILLNLEIGDSTFPVNTKGC